MHAIDRAGGEAPNASANGELPKTAAEPPSEQPAGHRLAR